MVEASVGENDRARRDCTRSDLKLVNTVQAIGKNSSPDLPADDCDEQALEAGCAHP